MYKRQAFAADAATTTTGSITVTGLTANDNTTLKVYKVVGFDEENSDWTIESWAQNHATNTNHVVNICLLYTSIASDNVNILTKNAWYIDTTIT